MKKKSPTTWQSAHTDIYPKYSGTQHTEILVVGGGVAGTTVAYFLAKAGKKVIVLDRGTLGGAVSAYTTAFLTRSLDSDLSTLKTIFGKRVLKDILSSHQSAIDIVESIISSEGIECEFMRVPNYMVAFSSQGVRRWKKEMSLSAAGGFPIEWVPSKTFSFKNKGGIALRDQAKFHPLKYLSGLRVAATKYGAKFFDNSNVTGLSGTTKVTALLEGGSVSADAVIVTTYNPFWQPWWYVFKKGMYVSYVYELAIPKGSLPVGLYEDDYNPYHYFRVDEGKGKDRLIVGGEDHRREIPMDREGSFKALRRFVEKRLGIKNYEVVRRWSGPILEQTDGLALIGRVTDNKYVATAFSGNGMTYGALAGVIISDQVLGKGNQWEKLYDPSRRIRLRAVVLKGKDYLDEFVGGMVETITANMKINHS